MQTIGAAVLLTFMAAMASFAQAECNCTVTFGPPIVFTEDPLVFAEEGVMYHATVEEIYFDAGECVVFINYPDGVTETYTEATGQVTHKITLAPHVAAHPVFAGKPAELMLTEVASGAAKVCAPNNEQINQPSS